MHCCRVARRKLTHLIFPFLVPDPLEDVMDDATSGGVAEKSVFVVDDETAVKRDGNFFCESFLKFDGFLH